MQTLPRLGRYFFAISIAAFGIQYLLYGRFVGGLPPVPPWTPGGAFLSYVVGAMLILAAVGITANWQARLSATLIGGIFLFCVVFLHTLHASAVIHDGVARTRALEPLSLAGAAFALAGTLPAVGALTSTDRTGSKLILFGRIVFAAPMVIFGAQHFQFAAFIATLIPSWIPGHLFWAYFTGIALIVAGIAILAQRFGALAANLLGLMFLLWTVLLHAPRVAVQLHNGDEWSSAFVALAFSGASFIVAGTLCKRD